MRRLLVMLILLGGISLVTIVSAAATPGTAEVDVHWVKAGSTDNTFTFTYNNPGGGENVIDVKITRPTNKYTITAGSSSGWTADVTSTRVIFTGGSIASGSSATFTLTADADGSGQAQNNWSLDGKSNTGNYKSATATGGGLDTGIDATAPTGQSIASISADSSSQLTVTAASGSDTDSGLHGSPHYFNETSGNSGASSSSNWQSSTSFSDSGLSPNTQYTYTTKLRDAVLNESADSAATAAYTLAATPTASSFSTVTETSIIAAWTTNSNPSGTEYYVENQAAGTNSGWVTVTTWTSSGLSQCTEYTFRVKSRNAAATETAFVSLGSKTTAGCATPTPSPTPTSDEDGEATDSSTGAAPATATIGPSFAAPTLRPAPPAANIGSPGTTSPDVGVGETVTEVPILETRGDTTPPIVTIAGQLETVDGAKVTFAGRAQETGDPLGVVAGLSYSFDGGISWHPVSTSTGIGTTAASFTVITPPLPDGTYDIVVRAKDNTRNEGLSATHQSTIDLLPVVFGGLVIQGANGDTIPTSDITVSSGTHLKVISAFRGGVVNASVVIGDNEVTLSPDTIRRRFSGKITATDTGSSTIILHAEDGAGNTLTKEIGRLNVTPSLTIVDADTDQPLSSATVTLEKFDADAETWRIDTTADQVNPQPVTEDGSVALTASHGTFRLRIAASGFWNTVTEPFTVGDTVSLVSKTSIAKRPWYGYIFPVRTRLTPLPSDNLFVSNAVESADTEEVLNITAKDTLGNKRTLSEFSGHRVLLTTLALWNRSSEEQLAILSRLQNEFGQDVVVIPWLVQQPSHVLTGVLERGQYGLTSFADELGLEVGMLDQSIIPSHFFFDRQGILRHTRAGFTNLDQLIDTLREIP